MCLSKLAATKAKLRLSSVTVRIGMGADSLTSDAK
jgi:hypothetical protein